MNEVYAVLPCNGIDKSAGCVAREIALKLAERGSHLICPVLCGASAARYAKVAQAHPLLVVDGCTMRCASKLAAKKGLKAARRINVADEARAGNISLSPSLRIGPAETALAEAILEKLAQASETGSSPGFPAHYSYETYQKGKRLFRFPKDPGFWFNENDCWAFVSGNTARIGVTDFVQKSLSDLLFFDAPAPGGIVEQFGEAGSIESSKAVFEVISPVSGKITAINEALLESPELANEDPYEKGWIAEIALSDFETDKELLHTLDTYFPIIREKIDTFE